MRRMMSLFLGSLAPSLLLAANGEYTPTKWAVPGGSASGSCSQASPCSLTRAMETASPGDVVAVAAGVHTANCAGTRHTPAFNPAKSGTASSPIVFFGPRTGARAELRCASGAGPAMGVLERSHIVFDGLMVDENRSPSVSDTGPMVLWSADHVTLRNVECIGKKLHREDNHNCLRLEYARDIQILDSRFSGVMEEGPPGQNTACVMAYDAVRVRFAGNEVRNCDVGLFIKGFHGGTSPGLDAWTVERNVIEGSWAAIHIGGMGPLSEKLGRSHISDNALLSNARASDIGGWGIVLHSYNANSPRAITISNNTIVASAAGIIATAPGGAQAQTDIEIRDNVVNAGRVALNFHWKGPRPGFISNNNLLWAPVIGATEDWYTDGGPRQSLGTWRTRMGLDERSVSYDPKLGPDHKLPADSKARTGSSAGGVMGIR